MRDPAHTGLSSGLRSRLVIDRYSSVLSNLPSRRRASLADAGSPDAEIWNVFRTLVQLDPSLWLPRLLALGEIRLPLTSDELAAGVGVTLWKRIKPPPERLAWLRQRALRGEVRPPVGRKRRGRVIPLSDLREELKARARRRLPLEDPLEVDVIVKTRGWVLLVEIPGADHSPAEPAASDGDRTYLLRLVDAGLSYAEARSRTRRHPVGFALLILPTAAEAERGWEGALQGLASSPGRFRKRMPHRGRGFDPAGTLRHLGVGSWSQVGALLSSL